MERSDRDVVLLIGGAPRSGTTLLWRLLNTHPDIRLTYEFNNISSLGVPYDEYRRAILAHIRGRGFYGNRVLGLLQTPNRLHQLGRILSSYGFVARYFYKLRGSSNGVVDLAAIQTALKQLLGRVRIVGDKYPGYITSLDTLSNVRGLLPVVIYRDCRDVTSSTLARVRTDWRNASFAKRMNTAGKVATSWVDAIKTAERNAEGIRMVRYEDLILDPERTLHSLAEWIGVDPGGLSSTMIRRDAIGKHKHGLRADELNEVMDIAGPTMMRLGYK